MSHLRKTVGNSCFLQESRYRFNRYILGIDLEKVSGAGFTGINTKAGEMLTINFRGCENPADPTASIPGRVFCAMYYDAVLNIKSEGVELLD